MPKEHHVRGLFFVLVFTVCTAVSALAQSAPPAAAKFGPQWQLLVGAWTGEASAGGGAGSCAFRFELGEHILVRTNHAEIPGKSASHDDLMVISPGTGEGQAQASYWDNEGHRIEYSGSWSADGSTLTFLSKPAPGPQFRLTYKKVDADTLTVSFDMAPPGQTGAFKTYTSGKIRRQK
jgi:hypothetical protein